MPKAALSFENAYAIDAPRSRSFSLAGPPNRAMFQAHGRSPTRASFSTLKLGLFPRLAPSLLSRGLRCDLLAACADDAFSFRTIPFRLAHPLFVSLKKVGAAPSRSIASPAFLRLG